MEAPSLSTAEKQRYSRHLLLPEIGLQGQQKLKAARVLVVGAGGLGSPSLLYLAAAGIGTIGIVDFDKIDESNLQRQILYSTDQLGKSKAREAAARLASLNPHISINVHEERLSAENAAEVMEPYELILDGSDNFSTRYLVNDACILFGKTNVYASIYRFEGQVSVFAAKDMDGPCYRCLFPDPPEPDSVQNCAEAGVMGVIAGIVGCIQANECIKLICGIGSPLIGRLLIFDALQMSFDELKISRNKNCPLCGTNRTISKLIDISIECQTENNNKDKAAMKEITATELKQELQKGEESLLVLDVRTPQEVALGRLETCVHIPLQELQERFEELDPKKDIVVYCKSGGRSRRAIDFLQAKGFEKLRNLTGGITAWSIEVDPKVVVG